MHLKLAIIDMLTVITVWLSYGELQQNTHGIEQPGLLRVALVGIRTMGCPGLWKDLWYDLKFKEAGLCPGLEASICMVCTFINEYWCIFKIFVYLFIFDSSLLHGLSSSCGRWGQLSSFGVWASHCSGFSRCRAPAPWRTGSSSRGSPAPEHRLGHSAACGIFPDQGSNGWSLHCKNP